MFREKLNRKNVTVDVKHFEDCEQLFVSVGECYVIEALLEFFKMASAKDKPTANGPHSVNVFDEGYRKGYMTNTLDKFLNEYVFEKSPTLATNGVWCYGANVIKSYLVLGDINDAVATGNGDYLTALRKHLLAHFFATP